MNNINSAVHAKTPAIPANNPAITPAIRRVGADACELEVGTGTSEVGMQRLRVDKCTPEIARYHQHHRVIYCRYIAHINSFYVS